MGQPSGCPSSRPGDSVDATLTRKDPPGRHSAVTGGSFLMPGGTAEDRRNRRRRSRTRPPRRRAFVPGLCRATAALGVGSVASRAPMGTGEAPSATAQSLRRVPDHTRADQHRQPPAPARPGRGDRSGAGHQGGRARVSQGCRRRRGTGVDDSPLAWSVRRHGRGGPGVVHGAGARPRPTAGPDPGDANSVGRCRGGHRRGGPGGVASRAPVEPWAFASKASRGRLISNARWL